MLFHRSGPLSGQPRGYAFVTYKRAADAVKALKNLDGQKIGIKHCSIRYAKNVNYDELMERPKPRIEIPALAAGGASGSGGPQAGGSGRKVSAIQAIEAKLKMLENRRAGDEFHVNSRAVSTYQEAPIQNYQFNLNAAADSKKYPQKRNQRSHHQSRPYSRDRPHRR